MSLMTDNGMEFWGGMWQDTKKSNYIPGQLEIKFFFPLTEQIPLDLDYEESNAYHRNKITPLVPSINGSSGQTVAFSHPPTWTTAIINNEIETKKISIVHDKKPNFVVRFLYKILKINLKI